MALLALVDESSGPGVVCRRTVGGQHLTWLGDNDGGPAAGLEQAVELKIR